jgi:antitoxin VapB
MSLNIKDPKTHALARELSRLTGESMTRAVTVAVRERLDRERKRRARASVDEMLAIGRRIRARLREPAHSLDHDPLFYDETGRFG